MAHPHDEPVTEQGRRVQEAAQRFYAVLAVNQDRIPPEVGRALSNAFAEASLGWAALMSEAVSAVLGDAADLAEEFQR